MSQSRYAAALAALDAANAQDPNLVEVAGARRPAELAYAERMSAALERLYPDASELLRLAVRGQHLMRWTVPRSTYPEGRAGYHRWRNDLKRRHAQIAAEILAAHGYAPDEVARVASLIKKRELERDAEAQALEDAACLVFLEHYLSEFAARTEPAKMVGILRKTWAKMSPAAHAAAQALPLPPHLSQLLRTALSPRQD